MKNRILIGAVAVFALGALALPGGASAIRERKAVASTPSARAALESAGARLLADYGSFAVYAAPDGALAKSANGVTLRDDLDIVRLRRGDVDTRAEEARAATSRSA